MLYEVITLCPAMQEVQPAILYGQVAAFLLGFGLVPEIEFAPVVDLPGYTVHREHALICDR